MGWCGAHGRRTQKRKLSFRGVRCIPFLTCELKGMQVIQKALSWGEGWRRHTCRHWTETQQQMVLNRLTAESAEENE